MSVSKRLCVEKDSNEAQAKLSEVAQEIGREIRVYVSSTPRATDSSATPSLRNDEEEEEGFYEYTAEDYYRMLSHKKEDKFLKTRKIREQEEAARRTRFTKAVIKVRFPDSYILEANFHPTETIGSLYDFLKKVIARPNVPFYVYVTPPKQKLQDMSKDFFSVGCVPGAIVYFSYEQQKVELERGSASHSGSFLREDIMALAGITSFAPHAEDEEPLPEPVHTESPRPQEVSQAPTVKKTNKPKWLKM